MRRRNQLGRAQLAQQRLALRRRTPRMKSWRKKKLQWLCSIIYQIKLICWAITIIKHYEFRLKQQGLFPLEEHLSIHDSINNTPKDYLAKDGALIVDLSFAANVLKDNDVLLERDCKLTESLDDAPRSDPNLERHFSTEVKLHRLYANPNSYFDQDRSDALNAKICKHLKDGCVAARITIYTSYNHLKWKEIYCPTQQELDTLVHDGHAVLLTNYDFDAEDRLFYQYQDSYGVESGDKGYAYIYADSVRHFVEIGVVRSCS